MKTVILMASILLAVLSKWTSLDAGVVEFEEVNSVIPFEGMSISNQFRANFGMSLRRRDSGAFPVIAKYGPPSAAFTLNGGADDKLTVPDAEAFGEYFLTDDVASQSNGTGIIIDFVEPVSRASGYLLDVNGRDSVTVVAFSDSQGFNTLDTQVFSLGAAGTGNGKAALWSFIRPTKEIRRIDIISNEAEIGYDRFSSDYVPPLQQAATVEVRMVPGVVINGDVGRPYRVDYADSLDRATGVTNWHALTTVFLPRSPFLHLDLTATNSPVRLYRVVGIP